MMMVDLLVVVKAGGVEAERECGAAWIVSFSRGWPLGVRDPMILFSVRQTRRRYLTFGLREE